MVLTQAGLSQPFLSRDWQNCTTKRPAIPPAYSFHCWGQLFKMTNRTFSGLLWAIFIGASIVAGSTSAFARVRTPLAITSPNPLPSGTVGTAYSATLKASGGTAPYTWAVTACSGSCNTGLSSPTFTSTGVLSGTPTGSGTSTFTFVVKDANGNTASAALGLTIASATSSPTTPSSPTSPLAVTSPSTLPSGTVSATYNASLTATGGTTPYTWGMKGCSGICDPNLTFSQTGVFSGTPAKSGSSTYSIGVTDANGQTASASLSLTIAAATSSSGANYYVSPSGSDSNPCTQASPCATPDHAFNLASPGETVQVAPGTYDYGSGGAASFSKSGTAGHYITVTCATRGACKIQNSVTGNATVVYISANYMTFDGFEVTNTSSAGNNLALYVTSSYVNITHNTIHHIETDCGSNGGGGIQIAGSGSQLGAGHDITMDSNLIYDINYTPGSGWRCSASTVQSDGILSETAGANIVVTNNIIHHTGGGWGILIGSNGAVVGNNLVFSTSNGGILDGLNTGYIVNNMVFNTGVVSGQCGIMLNTGNNVTVANNNTYGNSGAEYCVEWGSPIPDPGSGDISVNPALGTTFANWQADGSGDYHEKAGSPTIGSGNSNLGPPPATDFDGKARSAPYDMGAYQYN